MRSLFERLGNRAWLGAAGLLALSVIFLATCAPNSPMDAGLLGAGKTPAPVTGETGNLPTYERLLGDRGFLTATPSPLAGPTETPMAGRPFTGGIVAEPILAPTATATSIPAPVPTATPTADCSEFLILRICEDPGSPTDTPVPFLTVTPEPEETPSLGPRLYTAIITPRDVVLSPGDVVQFEVQALDRSGNRLTDASVRWSAQGGAIGRTDGIYRAGRQPGVYAVFATVTHADERLPVVTTVVIQ